LAISDVVATAKLPDDVKNDPHLHACCGAGADVCIAAMLIGKEGKVFGIDCTPAMVAKASENVTASGFPQAVLQEAEMTELPLPDCAADVVISNIEAGHQRLVPRCRPLLFLA